MIITIKQEKFYMKKDLIQNIKVLLNTHMITEIIRIYQDTFHRDQDIIYMKKGILILILVN